MKSILPRLAYNICVKMFDRVEDTRIAVCMCAARSNDNRARCFTLLSMCVYEPYT